MGGSTASTVGVDQTGPAGCLFHVLLDPSSCPTDGRNRVNVIYLFM